MAVTYDIVVNSLAANKATGMELFNAIKTDLNTAIGSGMGMDTAMAGAFGDAAYGPPTLFTTATPFVPPIYAASNLATVLYLDHSSGARPGCSPTSTAYVGRASHRTP